MGEVEAQLVRADVGARLAHVRAEALAQRGVQQVRRGVVGLGRVARRAVDARDHLLALVQRALLDLDDHRLVVARARHVDDARAAVARLAGDHAGVGDLAAALGVERRAVELRGRCRAARRDGRALFERLVARELRGRPLQLEDAPTACDRPTRARARAALLAPSARAKPASSTPSPASVTISRVRSNGKP